MNTIQLIINNSVTLKDKISVTLKDKIRVTPVQVRAKKQPKMNALYVRDRSLVLRLMDTARLRAVKQC
eukprot:1080321-Amorphochlora_amoeboformis.AAC.1